LGPNIIIGDRKLAAPLVRGSSEFNLLPPQV